MIVPVDLDGFAGFQVFDAVDDDGLWLDFDVLRGFALGRDAPDGCRLPARSTGWPRCTPRSCSPQLVDAKAFTADAGCGSAQAARMPSSTVRRAASWPPTSRRCALQRAFRRWRAWRVPSRRESERVFGGVSPWRRTRRHGLRPSVASSSEIFRWIEPVVVGLKRKMLVRGIVSHVPPLVRHCLVTYGAQHRETSPLRFPLCKQCPLRTRSACRRTPQGHMIGGLSKVSSAFFSRETAKVVIIVRCKGVDEKG